MLHGTPLPWKALEAPDDRQRPSEPCGALIAVPCSLYFYDAVQTLGWNNTYYLYTCEQREQLFYTERNAYMTGLR